MNITAIIQARMNSSRLPGKVMLSIDNKTVLTRVIDNIKKVRNITKIVVATSTSIFDDVIELESKLNNVDCIRGSEDNVLERFRIAALENNSDVVVRITADCPLIDSDIVERVIQCYLNGDYQIVTNAGLNNNLRTFPRGLDVEVFGVDVLEDAYNNAIEDFEKEHVTPYIYKVANNTKVYMNKDDLSSLRLTLDTLEDFTLLSKAIKIKEEYKFNWLELSKYLLSRKDLLNINNEIKQKEVIYHDKD